MIFKTKFSSLTEPCAYAFYGSRAVPPIDPWQHLLRDDDGEKKFGFELSHSLKVASETPLLAGWIFHATPSVKPPPAEMQG